MVRATGLGLRVLVRLQLWILVGIIKANLLAPQLSWIRPAGLSRVM